MQKKPNPKHLIETYIGISESAAKTVYELVNDSNDIDWVSIGKPRRQFLLSRRMFVADPDGATAEPTSYGRIAADLWSQITRGRYVPEDAVLNDKQLLKMNDPQKLARSHGARAYELMSAHIKLIRMVARVPGVSMFHLYNVFADHQLKHLIGHRLVRYADGASFQIYMAPAGMDLLRGWIES